MPTLFSTVQSQRIDRRRLIAYHFKFDHILQAYDTSGKAAGTKALTVIIEA